MVFLHNDNTAFMVSEDLLISVLVTLWDSEVLKTNDDKLALLWGEAQKKIAYSYLKVT